MGRGRFFVYQEKVRGFTSLAFVPANWGTFSTATASLDQSSQPELLAQKPVRGTNDYLRRLGFARNVVDTLTVGAYYER
jgi:hypothetical protein